MKKRPAALTALCLTLILAILPLTLPLQAFAARGFDEQDVRWLDLQDVTFFDFYDGLCLLESGGKFGYIDTSGDLVIPLIYDGAGRFSEGKAIARSGDTLGFIDRSNSFTAITLPGGVTAGNYLKKGGTTASYFFGGFVFLPRSDGDDALRSHNLLLDAAGNMLDFGETGRYAFGPVKDGIASTSHAETGVKYIDLATGEVLFDRETAEKVNADKLAGFDRISNFYVPDSGLFPFQVTRNGGYYYGFLDKTGTVVTDPIYSSFIAYHWQAEYMLFTDGLMSVADETGKFGCVDTTGRVVIPFSIADTGLYFSEGLAAVGRNGKYGMLDKSGREAVPLIYDRISDCRNGYIAAWKDGKAGLIDKTGAAVIPFVYTNGVSGVYDGTVIVSDAPGHIGIWRLAGTQAQTVSAAPTASGVLVNGEPVTFDAYLINDSNYLKLRDIAYVLSGTGKQFEIGWDGGNNAISLTSGLPYTAIGGEFAAKGIGVKEALTSTAKIMLDGAEIALTAYNIDGNNYFKLRDIARALNFGVTWDGANGIILISTSVGYTDD